MNKETKQLINAFAFKGVEGLTQKQQEERANHVDLGDGVYLEHTPEHIILRTGDHRDGYCDNKIYLEDQVLDSMMMAIDAMELKLDALKNE